MMLAMITALLPLVAILSLTSVSAQDKSVDAYPMWVTNDYNCVIDCLQIFNESVTDRPSPDTEMKGNECVIDKCNKDSMGMNIYQAHYIIQMFYATGSIYEDPNMGDWGQGTPPDKQQQATETTSIDPSQSPTALLGQSSASPDATSTSTAPPGESVSTTESSSSAASTSVISKPSAGAGNGTNSGGEGDESGAMPSTTAFGWVALVMAVATLAITHTVLTF